MFYHLTLKSGNEKTGTMPVSTTSRHTCPSSCPLKGNGCYADSGPLGIHWAKVNRGERGMNFHDFILAVNALPKDAVWRHNQAGDLPGTNRVSCPWYG
jgi:hypothetical protein